MDLREAYRELEIAPGADEAVVRDAKRLLAKVWHPDKHATDPSVLARAQTKLRTINAAFDAIRAAGFPAAGGATPDLTTTASPRPAPRPSPPARPAPPEARNTVEVVGRRRLRLWVVALFAAAIGVGAYLAIVRLGDRGPAAATAGPPATDAAIAPPTDAAIATDLVAAPTDGGVATATFTLGSTHDEVRAVMGAPTSVDHVIDETWSWGFSYVTFDAGGRVIGWWQRDRVLPVALAPRDPIAARAAAARGTLRKGSTRDEALGVLGTPTQIDRVIRDTWYWSFSAIEFDDAGQIVDWHQADRPLHIAP